MAKMGRPQKEINQAAFESLCAIFCTLDDICGFFAKQTNGVCSEDTIRRWVKRTYGRKETFASISKRFQGVGKVSLRRIQFKLAEKSAAMAIFLGKQYLGQKDVVSNEITGANGGAVQAECAIKIYLPDNGRDNIPQEMQS